MRDPNLDGVDHINIYSKGKTELGRLLTNFAHTPIVFEPFGKFESIEGLWYWLGTKDDKLKTMYGFQAKQYGRNLKCTEVDNFENLIKQAMWLKIQQHPRIAQLLKQNNLPFDHYYVYGNQNGYKVVDAGFKWITEEWEKIAIEIKAT